MHFSCAKSNSLMRRPLNIFTQESTTNMRPEMNLLHPRSMVTWSRVIPWDLWIVIAQVSISGNPF